MHLQFLVPRKRNKLLFSWVLIYQHWDTSDLSLLWYSYFAFSIFLYRHMKLTILEIYFFNMSRSWIETKMEFVPKTGYIMTPYSIAPVRIFSSLFSIYTVWCCQGNLFDNQQLYNLMIISFIPMILMFGSAVIRWGEIKCQTLLGVKGLNWYVSLGA